MNKRKISIIINILIVVFELFALFESSKNGRVLIEYYTIDSNILVFISSFIYLIYVLKNEKVNGLPKVLKYISTVCVTVTLIVVLVILLPMFNFNFKFLLLDGTMFFHHVFCPVLSIITFIFFDEIEKYDKKDVEYPLATTLLYAFILILLNLAGKVDGPYPFLRVYNLTISIAIGWVSLIFLINYFIAKYILKFKNQLTVHLK